MAKTGVAIPTYQESENIALLISALQLRIPGVRIVVVDDSPDMKTVDAAAPLCDERVRVVHRATKDGRGSAALQGIRELLADGCDRIVEMDADFSHDPAELPALLEAVDTVPADMIIASRYLPSSRIVNWPVLRRLFSRAANLLARTVLRVPVRDYTNGYRVYRRDAARTISETCGRLGKGFIPLSETLVNLYYRGYRVAEVSTVFVNRARGESSVTRQEIQQALVGLFRIHGLKRRLVNNPQAGPEGAS